MRKSNIIKIIIMLLIIILIITILLLIIENRKSGDNINFNDEEFEKKYSEYVKSDYLKPETDKDRYFAVKNIVNNFLLNINSLNYKEIVKEETNTNIRIEILKKIISSDYINKYGKNDEEFYNSVAEYIGIDFKIESIKILDRQKNIDICLVNCKTKETKRKFTIVVKIDYINDAFCIYPFKYDEKDIEEIKEGEVLENEYNSYKEVEITDEEVAQYIFYDYIDNINNYTEDAYNMLDSEYKEKRFSNITEFYDYIEKNKDWLNNVKLGNCKIENSDNCIKYICTDQNNNYFIFEESKDEIMKYSVVLDIYTLDLPDFLEKYNYASEQGKVALNIQKFIQSINAKDYKYAYECLTDDFKKKYFNTQSKFEEYVRNNFYNNNGIQFLEFSKENNIYIYKILLYNPNERTDLNNEKTIIMKLNEGTDFEMSFNVN